MGVDTISGTTSRDLFDQIRHVFRRKTQFRRIPLYRVVCVALLFHQDHKPPDGFLCPRQGVRRDIGGVIQAVDIEDHRPDKVSHYFSLRLYLRCLKHLAQQVEILHRDVHLVLCHALCWRG